MENKPAQAILQLNKAWSADLSGNEPVLKELPPPYRAMSWVLRHAPVDAFIGNPVRHFQHLATRMNGPRGEIRTWRAWACFHLSESVLSSTDFPRDELQIEREQLIIPEYGQVLDELTRAGWAGEVSVLDEVMQESPAP